MTKQLTVLLRISALILPPHSPTLTRACCTLGHIYRGGGTTVYASLNLDEFNALNRAEQIFGGPMEQPSFPYDSLPPGSIRLIRIETCTDLEVQCEIKTTPLSSATEWFALSYVWGTSPADQLISLNGYQTKVTLNLLEALRAISHVPVSDPSLPAELWIWIDALCINQHDPEEKSVQVPLMGELFSRARSVFVWFGQHQDSLTLDVLLWLDAKLKLDDAKGNYICNFWLVKLNSCRQRLETVHGVVHSEMDALYSLYTYMTHSDSFDTNMAVREAYEIWQATSDLSSKLSPPGHPFWNGLASMVSNEWYRRIWTYQEINLAIDAHLLLPNDLMTYGSIERLSWISVQVVQSAEPYSKAELDNYTLAAASALGLRMFKRSDRALAIHLVTTRGRQCRDDKDIVYGLLGMLRPHVRDAIAVDYALSTEAVFAGAILVAVTFESPVNLPYIWERFCDTEFGKSRLPSWCPDLRDRSRGMNSISSRLDTVSDLVWEKYHDRGMVAYGEPYPTLTFSAWILDEVLHSGKCIPKMATLFEVNDPKNLSGELVVRTIRAIVELNKWLSMFDNTFPWVEIAVGNARLQHLLEFAFPAKANSNVSVESNTVAENIGSLCILADTSSLLAMKKMRQALETNTDLIMLSMLYLQALLTLLHEHNIFETHSGKLGYSMQPVSEGDILVYVPGAWSLHVVSQNKKCYRGVARVEDYMGDALLTVIKSPESSIQTFSVT